MTIEEVRGLLDPDEPDYAAAALALGPDTLPQRAEVAAGDDETALELDDNSLGDDDADVRKVTSTPPRLNRPTSGLRLREQAQSDQDESSGRSPTVSTPNHTRGLCSV